MDAITDHMGPDGVVTEGFAGAMKERIIAEHAAKTGGTVEEARVLYGDTKFLDDITSITGLAKTGIDSRRANTALTEAAKTAINRPGENATDQEKADYRKTLNTECGATGNLADYKYGTPPDLPKGLQWNEQGAKELAEFCCERGVPVDVYEAMFKMTCDNSYAAHNAAVQGQETIFTAAAKELTDKNQPDALIEMGRRAFAYINTPGWCSEAAIEAVTRPLSDEKDAAGNLKLGPDGQPARKGSMNDIPGDLAEWNRRGVPPSQVLHMAIVAAEMESGRTKTGSGTGGETPEKEAENKFVDGCNAKSPGMQRQAAATA